MSRAWPNLRGKKTSTRPRGKELESAIIQRGQESRAARAQGDAPEGRKIMAKLTKPVRDRISVTKFAFPKQRKEPLEMPLTYATLSRASSR